MRRLVSAGLLPERAGQPAKVWAHISLADLMVLDANSKLQDEWTERVRGEWAGHRAAASVAGVTAPRGWMATPPKPSRATRPSPRS
jgi:hypothetical protein